MLSVDTAFGGDSFVLVDAAALGFSLKPRGSGYSGARHANYRCCKRATGLCPSRIARLEAHIILSDDRTARKRKGTTFGRNAVAIRPGKIDRSPCGTGCSARMAVLHAKGELQVGERFIGESLIDSTFDCRVEETTTVGGKPAIVPSLSGSAWISGMRTLMLDPADPWPEGTGCDMAELT